MAERHPTPRRLARWAMAGASLAATSWLVFFLPISRLPTDGHGLWASLWINRLGLIASLVPLALGIAISQWAQRRLKRGVNSNLWSPAELDPVTALVTNPIWPWASLILVALDILLITSSQRGMHGGGIAFICSAILPTQIANQIRQLVTPKENSTGIFTNWQSSKPIQSKHWGDQPLHPSE
jgi:hypothetical protein